MVNGGCSREGCKAELQMGIGANCNCLFCHETAEVEQSKEVSYAFMTKHAEDWPFQQVGFVYTE